MDGYTGSQKKIIATAHTAVAFMVIAALVALAAWVFLKGLSFASRAVIPVATGFFLAQFFKPYYLWLEKKAGIPLVALLLLVVTVLLPIVLLVWWTGAMVVNDVVGLVKQIPVMTGRAMDGLESSFPGLHAVLGQLKHAWGWIADAIANLVGGEAPIDALAAGAGCDHVAEACSNFGGTVSNAVASTLNADTAKMAEIYANCSQTLDATALGVVQAGEEAVGTAVSAVSSNFDAAGVQAATGVMNLNTEKLGELYAAYGDQIKKVGASAIQAGYDHFRHATAGGGAIAAAATTGIDPSALTAEYGKTGLAHASAIEVVAKIGAGVSAVLRGFAYVLVTLVFFVYFLMAKSRIGAKIAEAIPLLKDGTRKLVSEQIDTLVDMWVGFYQRRTLICLVDGCFYGIGFWLVGLPYGFFIGLMLGALNLIPFFGSIVCLPIVLAFACFGAGESGLKAVLVLLVWGLGLFLDGHCIAPRIQGRKNGVGYAGAVFSFLLWTMLLGPVMGMLLAIPLSASCVVLWRMFCKVTRSSGII